MVSQSCSAAYSRNRLQVHLQIVPDHHDGTAELEVSPHEKISVVLPGEAPLGTSVMALDAGR